MDNSRRPKLPLNVLVPPIIVTGPQDEKPSATSSVRTTGSKTEVEISRNGPAGYENIGVTKDRDGTLVDITKGTQFIEASETPAGIVSGYVVRSNRAGDIEKMDVVNTEGNVSSWRGAGPHATPLPILTDQALQDVETVQEALKTGLDTYNKAVPASRNNSPPRKSIHSPKPM